MLTFTTELPDAQGLSLDATVQGEMTATWDDILNNGEYRLEFRDDDPDGNHPPYQLETTVAWDGTLEHTITNLLDGEQYSVRIRTQTDHVTGNWLTAEEFTKLVAADQPTITSTTDTSVGLEWVVNSNFDGSQQIYRRRTDYTYDGPGRLVGTVSTTATTFTDDTAHPGREYEYEIRALTQWVYADSNPMTVTTNGIGLSDRAVPPRGWDLEIDHPSGTTLTPDPLEGAVRRPTINGYPRVEIPVPYRERWHSAAVDDAPLRVWHNGSREPIDILEHRSLEEGGGAKRTVLKGRGGTQLDKRIVEDVDVQPTHEFVRDLLQEHTDYQVNVDDPGSDINEDVVLQAPATDAELEAALANAIADDVPLTVTDRGIETLQSGFLFDAVLDGGQGGTEIGSRYNEGEVRVLNGYPDRLLASFETDYRIPGEYVDIRILIEVAENDQGEGVHSNFEVLLNGETMDAVPKDALLPGLSWFNISGSPSDLEGSNEIEVVAGQDVGDEPLYLDMVAVHDGRYNYNYDVADPDSLDRVSGPELYPDAVEVLFNEITSPIAIAAAGVTVDADSDDGTIPEIGIRSPDGSFDTATATAEHEVTFSELTTSTQVRLGIGRQGEGRSDYPTDGYAPQVLEGFTLDGDLDDTPVLTDRSPKGKLMDVLREVLGYGNFVSEIRAEGDETIVEVTRLEGRPTDVDPDIASYSVDRQTEDVLERAIIYGGAQRVTRQTVDVAIGSWVDLPFPDSRLVEGKTSIYSGDTEFELGTDYELRRETADGQPRIKALADGSLSDGQTVSVDADVNPRGEYTQGDASDPERNVEDHNIPGLASKQMCDQVALYLVEETGDAIVDAEVTVPHDSVEWSVIEAIDPAQLPGDGPYQVREIEANASETTLQLGQGQTVDEAVQEIRDRTSRNAERV